MRIVDALHTFLQNRNRKSGLALGSRIRITPVQYGLIWGARVIQRLRGTDHEKLPRRRQLRVASGVDEQPPRAQYAHERGLAVLARDLGDNSAEPVGAVRQKLKPVDQQPFLPREKMHVEKLFGELDDRVAV